MVKRLFDPASMELWVDDSILVINKPAGLPSLPDGYNPESAHLKSILEPKYGPLWIVHRLDRDTSGVMIIARNAESHRRLNIQFEQRMVAKEYHAIVHGSPQWQELSIRLPLVVDGDRRHRTVVNPRFGTSAHTDLRVIQHFGRFTLLAAQPHTGRRHQIRAHLLAKGFPIVADNLYGGSSGIYLSDIKPNYHKRRFNEKPLLGRTGLHAWALCIEHPGNSQPLTINAPYPDDIRIALKQIAKYDPAF